MTFPGVDEGRARAVERARIVSESLADAARQARQVRRGQRLVHSYAGQSWWRRNLNMLAFAACVLLPTLAAILYFGLVAADQYVAEARFTVRNGEVPKLDTLGALTGMPSLTVVQDTQIVANFIHSRAMVEKLDRAVDLRSRFGRARGDILAHFDEGKPVEKLVDFWRGMTDVSIAMPSGIVTVTVSAFRGQDAVEIAEEVMSQSEALVNEMNRRMYADAVSSAEADLERARGRLTAARATVETGRNAEGLLDASRAGEGFSQLLLGLKEERLRLRQEIDTQLKYVAPDAPQIRGQQSRLDSTNAQILELEARLTAGGAANAAGESPLSRVMTRFDQQGLELVIAEKHYSSAIASLELARVLSEGKRVYLNAFVRPSLPQDARYPRRLLLTAAVSAGSFVLWAALAGAAGVVRNKLA